MCNLAMFEACIASTAGRASRLNRGGYNDFDDYVQIGRIAAWRASQTWKGRGSFPCYVRRAIRHEIGAAAIESRFVVSAPRSVKRTAIQVMTMASEGHEDQEIAATLQVTEDEFGDIRHMIAPVLREGIE